MKIEKLTENKIRVILNSDELGVTNMNVHNIMAKAMETQEIFAGILKKAEEEVDFQTDGCKLLIEALSSIDDIFVFTITKYLPDNECKKKKLVAKRKSFSTTSEHAVCSFSNFDLFCEFCIALSHSSKLDTTNLAKNITLYIWKNNYYLILKKINIKNDSISLFYSTLSEFGQLLSYSNIFEAKLLEHGKVLIKKNAIDTAINFLK